MSIIIQLPLAFYLNQKRVCEIKSCSCHLDFCVYLIKRVDVIEQLSVYLKIILMIILVLLITVMVALLFVRALFSNLFLQLKMVTYAMNVQLTVLKHPDSDFESCF